MYGSKPKAAFKFQDTKEKRTKTLQLMKSASLKSPAAKELRQYYADESMLPLLSVLSSFSFARIHSTLDIYGLFHYEPMHCLSLGVERMSNECILSLLGDVQRQSPAMRCQNENIWSFKFLKRTVLSTLNVFLIWHCS